MFRSAAAWIERGHRHALTLAAKAAAKKGTVKRTAVAKQTTPRKTRRTTHSRID
jgi:hypothetical protein